LLPPVWRLRIQSAITTEDSEPEPDLVLVRGSSRQFLSRHPQPPDVGLVIEVADTTLSQDRNDKSRLYARAGIVEYWLVNVRNGQLEVFTHPSGRTTSPAYAQQQVFEPGQTVDLRLDGHLLATINVADLLP
jgi:Uma2 family endonuclease